MCLLFCEGRVSQKVVEVVDSGECLVVSQGFLPLVYSYRITGFGGGVKGVVPLVEVSPPSRVY